MNIAVAFSFLSPALISCVASVTLASQILIISPFDKADVDVVAGKSNAQSSVQHLRATLVAGELNDQLAAGAALVRLGDDKSIARLVYAARQGNPVAWEILLDNPSLKSVPMLLEDIAHGGDISSIVGGGGDCVTVSGSVRGLALQAALGALSSQTSLPKQTLDWFHYLRNQSLESQSFGKSKLLLEWWDHNQSAVRSGRLDQAVWLPEVRTLPDASENPSASEMVLPPPPPPPPPPAKQKQLAETFDVWVRRIANPANLDLTFAPMERAAAGVLDSSSSLSDPKLPSVEKNSLSRSNATFTAVFGPNGELTPWSIIVVSIMAAGGLLWLLLKRRS